MQMMNPQGSIQPRPLHQRAWMVWLMLFLLALGFVASLALWQLTGNRMEALSTSPNAQALADQLNAWIQVGPGERGSAGPSAHALAVGNTLWLALLLDSVMLVPAYVGVLIASVFMLTSVLSLRGAALPHVVSALPLSAGLFDIAENGMLGRAVKDYLWFVLDDETVWDIHSAHDVKWALLAVSLMCVAFLVALAALKPVVHRPPLGRLWLAVGLSLATVLLVLIGLLWLVPMALQAGALLLGLSLLSLVFIWVPVGASGSANHGAPVGL